jgi:hypothetical protein
MNYTIVQEIMIDNSYKKMFSNLINNFSSLNRLLNYSILVIELSEVYDKLIQGDSVNSFTKYIQESQFSNRFGLTNNEHIFCFSSPEENKINVQNNKKYLFTEQYPERAGKYLKDLFLKNSDITVDIPVNNLLNPYAWSKFLKDWKEGKLKRE